MADDKKGHAPVADDKKGHAPVADDKKGQRFCHRTLRAPFLSSAFDAERAGLAGHRVRDERYGTREAIESRITHGARGARGAPRVRAARAPLLAPPRSAAASPAEVRSRRDASPRWIPAGCWIPAENNGICNAQKEFSEPFDKQKAAQDLNSRLIAIEAPIDTVAPRSCAAADFGNDITNLEEKSSHGYSKRHNHERLFVV